MFNINALALKFRPCNGINMAVRCADVTPIGDHIPFLYVYGIFSNVIFEAKGVCIISVFFFFDTKIFL
jgi:hypothetical protein